MDDVVGAARLYTGRKQCRYAITHGRTCSILRISQTCLLCSCSYMSSQMSPRPIRWTARFRTAVRMGSSHGSDLAYGALISVCDVSDDHILRDFRSPPRLTLRSSVGVSALLTRLNALVWRVCAVRCRIPRQSPCGTISHASYVIPAGRCPNLKLPRLVGLSSRVVHEAICRRMWAPRSAVEATSMVVCVDRGRHEKQYYRCKERG